MKPTHSLLRPSLAPQASGTAVKPRFSSDQERDKLVLRKQVATEDIQKLKLAERGVAVQLAEVLATLRRETSGRPKPVAGAVVVRVVGATCNDKSEVPLPNLRVTLEGGDGARASALTDVTGLAVLRPMRDDTGAKAGVEAGAREQAAAKPAAKPEGGPAAYHLQVIASDGTTVASTAGDASGTHFFQLGENAALAGHAALGRGWVAALDKAEQRREGVAKSAAAELARHRDAARARLTAIEGRLALHHKKS